MMAEYKESISARRLREAEKSAFTLSTAALVLTVTFKSTLLEGQTAGSTTLIVAWVALSVSVIAHVITLLVEALGHGAREREEKLDSYFRLLQFLAVLTWGGFLVGMGALAFVGIITL